MIFDLGKTKIRNFSYSVFDSNLTKKKKKQKFSWSFTRHYGNLAWLMTIKKIWKKWKMGITNKKKGNFWLLFVKKKQKKKKEIYYGSVNSLHFFPAHWLHLFLQLFSFRKQQFCCHCEGLSSFYFSTKETEIIKKKERNDAF